MEKTFNHRIFEKPVLGILALGLLALSITFAGVFGISFWLPLAVVLMILSLILFVQHPLVLLSLLIITRMSLDYSAEYFTLTLWETSFSLSQLLGASIAILGVIIILIQYKTLLRFQLAVPFLIVFLWGGATLAYSIAPFSTLQELLRFFGFFTLGFLAYVAIQKTDDFKKLLLAFFASSLLPIIFALYQWALGIGFQDDAFSSPRIFGTFSHPNVFSLYLFTLIVFALLYFFLFARSHRDRLVILLLLGIFTITLFLTFARVAWLALFIFTFLLALFRYRLLLFPLIFFPLVLFVFSQNFQERVLESLAPRPDSSIVWRQNLWHDVTTQSIQDGNFWFGSGMNTFPIVSENLRGISFGSNDAHNDFIKFFVEGGIIGLAVYLLYLASIFFILIKNYLSFHLSVIPAQAGIQTQNILKLSFGVLFLFFFVITIASLSDNVFRHTPVQWLFFAASGGLLALAKKEKIKRSGAI